MKSDENTVFFFGWGVYDGDHPFAMFPEEPEFTIPIPRITLNDGGVVWGAQCWWGPESAVRSMIGDRQVVIVAPPSAS